MKKENKFKKGDIVYSKVWLAFDYDLSQIVSFDEGLNMYIVIHFLDNLTPETFWRWCYIKEDDLDFADKLFDASCYKDCFKVIPKLDKDNFEDFYSDTYYVAKKLYDGKITKEECHEEMLRILEKFIQKDN